MNQFNEEYDDLLEGYKPRTMSERFPRKLKLSENFVRAFNEEFKRQAVSVITEEDEDGVPIKTEKRRNPRQVLKEFQKALPFLLQRHR